MIFNELKDFAPQLIEKSIKAFSEKKISREELSFLSKTDIHEICLLEKYPRSFCCGGWRESEKKVILPQNKEPFFIEAINALQSNPELISILKKIFETNSIEFKNAAVII